MEYTYSARSTDSLFLASYSELQNAPEDQLRGNFKDQGICSCVTFWQLSEHRRSSVTITHQNTQPADLPQPELQMQLARCTHCQKLCRQKIPSEKCDMETD